MSFNHSSFLTSRPSYNCTTFSQCTMLHPRESHCWYLQKIIEGHKLTAWNVNNFLCNDWYLINLKNSSSYLIKCSECTFTSAWFPYRLCNCEIALAPLNLWVPRLRPIKSSIEEKWIAYPLQRVWCYLDLTIKFCVFWVHIDLRRLYQQLVTSSGVVRIVNKLARGV